MSEIGFPHKLSHQNGGNDEISVLGISGLLADSQTPLAHKISHQNGGADEINLAGLAGQLVLVPFNQDIGPITQADTNKHFLDLATALSESRTIVGILISPNRSSGSGSMRLYPNEGTIAVWTGGNTLVGMIVIASGSQRLQYDLTVANDVFAVYCFGYVVLGV